MKIKVEYSESIQISEGLWRKCGIEIENNPSEVGGDPDPQLLYNQAKEYVQRWHKEAMPTQPISPNWDHNTPLPVIEVDRPLSNTIDALIKDIESCKDLPTIDSYRVLVKTKPELKAAFDKRRSEIVKVESEKLLAATEEYYKKQINV